MNLLFHKPTNSYVKPFAPVERLLRQTRPVNVLEGS